MKNELGFLAGFMQKDAKIIACPVTTGTKHIWGYSRIRVNY
jgi:hypothetical protein